MAINQAHVDQWVEELRTTKVPQARETLVMLNGSIYHQPDIAFDAVVGMCCLGVGEYCAQTASLYEMNHHDLPSPNFARWLGLEHFDDEDDGVTIWINWAEEYTLRSQAPLWGVNAMELAALNDTHALTFAQIADCIAYFGLKDQ